MTKPFLSVLIDTYNHERYIEQAVVSAIEQDFPAGDYEILVVDDGSTDRTATIVQKFEPRVRLLRKKNGGQASAFNAAFPELQGEFIALLDGDDWWAKGKLAAVVDGFERAPQEAAISHAYYEVRESEDETRLFGPREEEVLTLDTPEEATLSFQHWHFLLPCALTVRRKVFERVFPIPEVLIFSADGPIAAAAMAMRARVLPQPLAYYRVHSANLNAIDNRNSTRMRRKYKMGATMFEIVGGMLQKEGVRTDCIAALLDPAWVQLNRAVLARLGGRRLETLRTEMRAFRAEYRNPSLVYRLFKYVVVGAAATLLSPRQFYGLWNWYGGQKVAHFPEPFRRSS